MKNINRIEDIFPLTIIQVPRGKFAIVEAFCDAGWSENLFNTEKWGDINYGIGRSIAEAFEDFKNRYNG